MRDSYIEISCKHAVKDIILSSNCSRSINAYMASRFKKALYLGNVVYRPDLSLALPGGQGSSVNPSSVNNTFPALRIRYNIV